MFDQPIERMTIIGTGLLGASAALALRRAGFAGSITGVARRRETLHAAQHIGAIDTGTSNAAEACADADLVLIATPVGTAIRLLAELRDGLMPTAIVTDVGSTKRTIVEAAATLRQPGRFVGAHPMAGAETSGPQAARADLFEGRPVIVTPTHDTDPACLKLVETMWRSVGMQLVRLSPEQHDTAVAQVSHLPHVVSAALMLIAADSGRLNVASTGLASTTRLAAGETEMWADILTDNAPAVTAALDEASHRLSVVREMIHAGDRAALVNWLEAARDERQRWAGRPESTQ